MTLNFIWLWDSNSGVPVKIPSIGQIYLTKDYSYEIRLCEEKISETATQQMRIWTYN